MFKRHSRAAASRALLNRRRFLKTMAAASVAGSGLGAVNGKLGLIGNALAATGDYVGLSDYKALVCVFLYGGSDSFNMFVPTDDALFQQYLASRGSLSVAEGSLLLPTTDVGFGFNQFMPRTKALFDAGQLAVVSNVGNLIEPVINKSAYTDIETAIPADLFAHNHQQEQWQKGLSSLPSSLVNSGWGGRMADLLQEANGAATLPPTFSLFGSNHWLPGSSTTPLSVNRINGLEQIAFMNRQSASQEARANALSQILSLPYSHIIEQQVAQDALRSINSADQLIAALDGATEITTPYDSSSRLGKQLRMVARLMQSRQALGMNRQIFFVGLGGWDTHDNQGVRLDSLLRELDTSLADFQNTVDALGLSDSVTTFTASDFGRTLSVNGDGSDHGWGGHYLVMGGAVDGGRLYGSLPSFVTGADDDADDKGRVIPRLSVNQMGASLGGWLGLSESDLQDIFPDLANFGSGWQDPVRFFGSPPA
ncbi:MAG: DUF1501 domain-containing protein [Pseudomonadota bacterium]